MFRSCAVLAVVLMGAGCSVESSRPPTSSSAQLRSQTVTLPMALHGVLHVPSPQAPGPQGRLDPWLAADDGNDYDLVLGPGFEPLSDPASSGRGVTIRGEVTLEFPVPVGASSRQLQVSGYEFD